MKMTFDDLQKIMRVCLKSADDSLRSAEAVANLNVDHIRFHLATLALEEIGKIALLKAAYCIQISGGPEEESFLPTLDDHIKKLFWAFWTRLNKTGKITKEEIDRWRGIARNIHEKRLRSLYSDPEVVLEDRQIITKEETDHLVGLARARLELEQASEIGPMTPQLAQDLKWFLTASDDVRIRSILFGDQSLEKLAEVGSHPLWIRWLREFLDAQQQESIRLAQDELSRAQPGDHEASEPKWKVRIRVVSDSHSIKAKDLEEWNKRVGFLKLAANSTKKGELLFSFTMPKSVSVHGLWASALGMSTSFIAALNIGTGGFFWWYTPRHPGRFYDEIRDMDTNAGCVVERSPKLEVGWRKGRITKQDLSLVNLAWAYLMSIAPKEEQEPVVKSYLMGLTMLSKNDIHFQIEPNAFSEFFRCFKQVLQVNGDWDGTEDILAATHRTLGIDTEIPGLAHYIAIGTALEKNQQSNSPVTLTEVIGIKSICDTLFVRLAVDLYRSKHGTTDTKA
jgi:AbiV family abortive infection protein